MKAQEEEVNCKKRELEVLFFIKQLSITKAKTTWQVLVEEEAKLGDINYKLCQVDRC